MIHVLFTALDFGKQKKEFTLVLCCKDTNVSLTVQSGDVITIQSIREMFGLSPEIEVQALRRIKSDKLIFPKVNDDNESYFEVKNLFPEKYEVQVQDTRLTNASNLTKEEFALIKKEFETMDEDGDGKVSILDIHSFVEKWIIEKISNFLIESNNKMRNCGPKDLHKQDLLLDEMEAFTRMCKYQAGKESTQSNYLY